MRWVVCLTVTHVAGCRAVLWWAARVTQWCDVREKPKVRSALSESRNLFVCRTPDFRVLCFGCFDRHRFRPMIDAIMTGACAWLPAANSAKALVREHHLAS